MPYTPMLLLLYVSNHHLQCKVFVLINVIAPLERSFLDPITLSMRKDALNTAEICKRITLFHSCASLE